VLEEHFVGHQARHRHHLPAGAPAERIGEAPEVRNRLGPDRQAAHAVDELVAGARRQKLRLALEKRAPNRVLGRRVALPGLVDGPVGSLGPDAGGGAVLHPLSLA
jgi:hypothetical protein